MLVDRAIDKFFVILCIVRRCYSLVCEYESELINNVLDRFCFAFALLDQRVHELTDGDDKVSDHWLRKTCKNGVVHGTREAGTVKLFDGKRH